jgi:hypothetical protein
LKHVGTLFFAFLALLSVPSLAQVSLASGQPREEMTSGHAEGSIAVKLYPNPAIEYVHVSFEEPIARQSRLTVHNIIGNILDVEMEAIDDHEVRVRVKDLPVGYYLIAVRDDQSKGRSTLKFLKR